MKTRNTPAKSGHAPVNGLKMYYEIRGAEIRGAEIRGAEIRGARVRGAGEPLVLLHGGVGASEMFGPNLQALAENRQVIAPDLQGHGRTADINRPLSFESMADDVAALIT